jgi:hypothetical protein
MASSRCWIAGLMAAARLWCCWRSPPGCPGATDLRLDLAVFDRLFGLPAARLQVVTSLVGGASRWLAGAEEVADAEIVHALAPAAVIRVVFFRATAGTSAGSAIAAIAAALRLAVSQGGVISVSYGWGERCVSPAGAAQLNSALQAARDRHVTVVASSGDLGAASLPCPGAGAAPVPVTGVNLPASDPLVLAAGGTTLQASHATGAYAGETAWNTAPQPPLTAHSYASGGGFSGLFPRPAYQDGVPGTGRARGVPDVAAGVNVGDVLRASGAGVVEHPGRDVDSDHLGSQPGQIAAHPALAARDVQHPLTGYRRNQDGMRRDQWRRVADPLLVPPGELVIPRLYLRHAPTLTGPARIAAYLAVRSPEEARLRAEHETAGLRPAQ